MKILSAEMEAYHKRLERERFFKLTEQMAREDAAKERQQVPEQPQLPGHWPPPGSISAIGELNATGQPLQVRDLPAQFSKDNALKPAQPIRLTAEQIERLKASTMPAGPIVKA